MTGARSERGELGREKRLCTPGHASAIHLPFHPSQPTRLILTRPQPAPQLQTPSSPSHPSSLPTHPPHPPSSLPLFVLTRPVTPFTPPSPAPAPVFSPPPHLPPLFLLACTRHTQRHLAPSRSSLPRSRPSFPRLSPVCRYFDRTRQADTLLPRSRSFSPPPPNLPRRSFSLAPALTLTPAPALLSLPPPPDLTDVPSRSCTSRPLPLPLFPSRFSPSPLLLPPLPSPPDASPHSCVHTF